jgi:SAM-dependent methyltransferase
MPDPTAAGYDALAPEYAEHLSSELERKPFDRELLARFAALVPPGPVLDAGCGPGHVGRYLQGLGRDVTGVDLSGRMVEVARERNPGMAFHVGDLRSLPFETASFAGTIAFYSIIHLKAEELPAAFAEMARVLVPEGFLLLAFHVGDEVRRVEELWGVKTCLDFVFFEPETVAAALAEGGFRIVETIRRGPYAPEVEAQTNRCYVLAQAGAGKRGD